jgi:hypothetical protein
MQAAAMGRSAVVADEAVAKAAAAVLGTAEGKAAAAATEAATAL